jgi:DNA-binding NtrC family response regulator
LSNNKRIVSVVDDDIHIAKLLHEALRQNIDEPGLNGLELLKKIKTVNTRVRTILMSAYNFEEEELYQNYMKEGVINSTIEKPVTMNRLYQRIREELHAYQSGINRKS